MAQPEPQAKADTGAGVPRRPVPGRSAEDDLYDSDYASPDADGRERFRGFLDLPISVSVQMGRKLMKFREVLALEVDSVVRMDKSAGENVDLLLENVTVGRGEIIVIEDLMGLRITDLIQTEADRGEDKSEDA